MYTSMAWLKFMACQMFQVINFAMAQETFSIAAFNIQIFGVTKAANVEVMAILAQVSNRQCNFKNSLSWSIVHNLKALNS